MMDLTRTDRGFAIGSFVDRYDAVCSIQKSSLATEDAIWLGIHEVKGEPARMHLSQSLAADLLPHLQRFVATLAALVRMARRCVEHDKEAALRAWGEYGNFS